MLFAGAMGRPTRRQYVKLFVLAIGLCAGSAWLGSALILFALSVWFVGSELRRRWFASDAEDAADNLALYFLAAWIAGLFLATPLYHPYPRLTLPWLCAVWIGAGAAIGQIAKSRVQRSTVPGSTKRWAIVLVIGTIALLAALPRIAERGWPAWQSRAGWLSVSERIIAEVGGRAEAARGNRDEAIVVVYGEPGLFFHLNVDGTQAFVPAADLSALDNPSRDPSVPTFLVTGPHAERTQGFHEDLVRSAAHLTRIAEYTYLPSDLVLLDQYHPRVLKSTGEPLRQQRVTLYQVVDERE